MEANTDHKTGITWLNEEMQGFVGTRGLSIEPCKNGRQRVRFDLVKGKTDLAKLMVGTWRHCVIYDDLAGKFQDIRTGEMIRVSGYVLTSIRRDFVGKPMFLSTGEPVVDDILMVKEAIRINYQQKQYQFGFESHGTISSDQVERLIGQLPVNPANINVA
jgi:hypothetical protein